MSQRIRTVVVLAVGLLGLGAIATSCNLEDLVNCDNNELNVQGGVVGDFGSTQSAQKIEAFFDATVALNRKAHALANTLVTACQNIGRAIEMDESAITPAAGASDSNRITSVCGAVATEIRTIVQAALPNGVQLTLNFVPPSCTVEVDAYASCAAECEADIDPGTLRVECEPGSIQVGHCEASCSGECWFDASASCTGSCSAQCTGSCAGNCIGTCDGVDSRGACAGSCVGQCDATCTGSCSGTCVASVDAGCTGECHGSCTDWGVIPPRCETVGRPPEVSIECDASCQASLEADIDCNRPQLTVGWTAVGADTEAQRRLGLLVDGLEANYGDVLVAAEDVGTELVNSVEAFFDMLGAFEDDVALLVQAAACVSVALSVQVEITATFSASVNATTSITASVSASGSAGAK